MNPVEILNDIVQELTQHPTHWCQHTLARDANGNGCSYVGPNAVRWCLEGHFGKRTGTIANRVTDAVHDYLDKHEKKLKAKPDKNAVQYGTVWPSIYNDEQGRTVDDIVALCKAVVENLK